MITLTNPSAIQIEAASRVFERRFKAKPVITARGGWATRRKVDAWHPVTYVGRIDIEVDLGDPIGVVQITPPRWGPGDPPSPSRKRSLTDASLVGYRPPTMTNTKTVSLVDTHGRVWATASTEQVARELARKALRKAGATNPTHEALKLRVKTVECTYCGRETIDQGEAKPPAVTDHHGWSELRKEHGLDCEWIRTRAHRI